MDRRDFLKLTAKTTFIFTGAIFIPKTGIIRSSFAHWWAFQGGYLDKYRYWRVKEYVDNADKSYGALWEVEFQMSGSDQATTGNVIFGAEDGTHVATRAFDDNVGLKWHAGVAAADANTWVGQDFGAGSEKAIDLVRVYPEYSDTYFFWIRVYSDSQADFSTETLRGEITTINAGAWNNITII